MHEELHRQRLLLAASAFLGATCSAPATLQVSLKAFTASLDETFTKLKTRLASLPAKGWLRVKLSFPRESAADSYDLTIEIEQASQPPLEFKASESILLKTKVASPDLYLNSFWKPASYASRWELANQQECLFVDKAGFALNTTIAAIVWGSLKNEKINSCYSSTPRKGVLESTSIKHLQSQAKHPLTPRYKVAMLSELESADYICMLSCIRGFRPGYLANAAAAQAKNSSVAASQLQKNWLTAIST